MEVEEGRSQQAHASIEEEGKVGTGKTRSSERKSQEGDKNKKAKLENKKAKLDDVASEFDEFCKATREHLTIEHMRLILEANEQDSSGTEDAVVPRCQDLLFYGPLERCPTCNGHLECTGAKYACRGTYNEWTTCPYSTRDSPRKEQAIKIPNEIKDDMVKNWAKQRESKSYPARELSDKPLSGMMIALSGRLSRKHEDWRREIEKNGGKVNRSVIGVTCVVTSAAERERGGSGGTAEAMERIIPLVREEWLKDSIEKKAPQPLDAYEIVADLAPDGRGIPWDKQDPSEEALESLTAEIKLTGKRGVYKDSKLQEEGGVIFEKDGIIYNCAFSICDQARDLNDYCILQLIMVPENKLHLYYKKGRVGDDARAEERVEEWKKVGDAIKEFARIFEYLTGNEFEPWEMEKKFEKKALSLYPVDMDDGVDVRHGGLGLRQLGTAAAHSKLDPYVAFLMKILCSQEIYRQVLGEMN